MSDQISPTKAQSAASTSSAHPSVHGSDQVTCLGDRLLRKPELDERPAAAHRRFRQSFEVLDGRVLPDSGGFWSRLVAEVRS